MSATSAAAAMPIPTANPLLSGRILPTLLQLALPNVLAMTATVLVAGSAFAMDYFPLKCGVRFSMKAATPSL